jgi:hypothetical protein
MRLCEGEALVMTVRKIRFSQVDIAQSHTFDPMSQVGVPTQYTESGLYVRTVVTQ